MSSPWPTSAVSVLCKRLYLKMHDGLSSISFVICMQYCSTYLVYIPFQWHGLVSLEFTANIGTCYTPTGICFMQYDVVGGTVHLSVISTTTGTS